MFTLVEHLVNSNNAICLFGCIISIYLMLPLLGNMQLYYFRTETFAFIRSRVREVTMNNIKNIIKNSGSILVFKLVV